MSVLDFVDDELRALEAQGRRRGVRVVGGRRGAQIELDGRWVVNFSSNDYLGLAGEAALVRAARGALDRHGVGAGASRLVTGTSDEVSALERELAGLHGAPAALVFNSGYAANTGIIPALVGRGDAVFSDELNHASIIDGCRLSRAEVVVWRHRDLNDLEQKLGAGRWRRRLIVSESVFSMDGDLAPLDGLRRLARARDAILMVDDAHAVGVSGPGGLGHGRAVDAEVVVATLGKAFGTAGAYVLADVRLAQFLWNSSRSLVFSTALPASVCAASRAAVAWFARAEGQERRRMLHCVMESVRGELARIGIAVAPDLPGPILPIIVGDDRRAVACTDALLEHGVLVQAIRPPTVPVGTARLRIAVSADHSEDDVQRLGYALGELCKAGLLSPATRAIGARA